MEGIRVTAAGEGEALWFLDTLMQVKLPAEGADGALSILEQRAPAGSVTPMHRHDQTDEFFYLLEGEATFYGGGEARSCGPGSFVAVRRGTPHAFRVTGDGEARLLVISTPASFERFVRAVSRPAPDLVLPPAGPPPPPEVMQQLAQRGAENDTVLLGPPPHP